MFPSDRLPLVERYAELLATEGVQRGLIGPREAPRLWDRHLLNCALLGEVLPRDATVCDLGSGAGLPAVVIAIARPDLEVTAVEPLLRRTTFLEEVVAELELGNLEVVRGRAADLHGRRRFDVVTARAVAPLARLLGWAMPLVAPTGALVAMKGSAAAAEVEGARSELARLGCAEPELVELGIGLSRELAPGPAVPTTGAVRVAWADPARVSSPSVTSPSSRRSAGRRRSTAKRRRST